MTQEEISKSKLIRVNPFDFNTIVGISDAYSFSFINSVIQALESIYPGKYEIQTNYYNRFIVIIKFDEFTITNSKEQFHVIKNMFVKLLFDEDCKLTSISGCRNSFSTIELNAGYMHSHLSSVGIFNSTTNRILEFSSFCLGTGALKQLEMILSSDFNDVTFRLFLYQLEVYLSWESLEGGPYMKINQLTPDSKRYIYSKNDIDYKTLFAYIDEFLTVNDFSLSIDSYLEIDNNERLESFIKKFLPKEHLVFISNNGNQLTNVYAPPIKQKDLSHITTEILFGDIEPGVTPIQRHENTHNNDHLLRVPLEVMDEVRKYILNKLTNQIFKNYDRYELKIIY